MVCKHSTTAVVLKIPGTTQQECHKRDHLRQAGRWAVIMSSSTKPAFDGCRLNPKTVSGESNDGQNFKARNRNRRAAERTAGSRVEHGDLIRRDRLVTRGPQPHEVSLAGPSGSSRVRYPVRAWAIRSLPPQGRTMVRAPNTRNSGMPESISAEGRKIAMQPRIPRWASFASH
jgi:hypothetical protein